ILHRGIEHFLDRGAEAMDLVDEQHVALFEIGQKRGEIAGLGNHGPRCRAKADAELARDDLRQRGLAQPGWPHEQHMIQRFAALPRRLDEHGKVGARLRLADELGKELRTQCGVACILMAALRRHDARGCTHFASSFRPRRMSCAVSAFSPALREAAAIAAAACGCPSPRLTKAEIASVTGRGARRSSIAPESDTMAGSTLANAGALSFNSVTMRSATFGPTPGVRVTAALSRNAMAFASSAGGSVPSTANATLAPTPCTVCNKRNHSRSMSLLKPNNLIWSSRTYVSIDSTA